MEINTQQSGEIWEVSINGRLDGYWADHLTSALEDIVRQGAHHIRLNMADIAYMSSAGIRVLLIFYKQLGSIQGSFSVTNPSENVRKVLEMSGLKMLMAPPATKVETAAAGKPTVKQFESASATFEVFELAPSATIKCKSVGNPELLNDTRFQQPDCQSISFPDSTFGVGLGAFGSDFKDCQNRFGEFLTVAGAATYLPTDGTNVPDYMMSTGELVPEINVLYGLVCEGPFSHLARFEAKKEAATITLSDLVDQCLKITGASAVGIVMAAESAGLMGASLRKSPALGPVAGAPFTHPEIRDWLSFAAERSHTRGIALVVGVATKRTGKDFGDLLRPLTNGAGEDSQLMAHLHAAAFSYRPLQKGALDLKKTVTTLFETENVRDVLHLLKDDRQISGAGQSEFIRGACWIGRIA